MRYNDASPNHHQIIHAHSCPLPSAVGLLSYSKLRSDLPTPVQKDPHKITLLDPTYPTGDIRAVVEHKWDIDLGHLNRLLQRQKLLPQALSRLRFP